MIIGFNHAQITIPIAMEQEARLFYCDLLQLPEIQKPSSLEGRGGLWVKVGSQALHIGTEDGVDRLKTKAHLAYEVEDIEYMKQLLIENHIEIIEAIPIPGFIRFEFRDPFGNRVEFIKTNSK
jgi:catechol 2,3-dioxygenase-like lactoylglutathione lyase family enzyme